MNGGKLTDAMIAAASIEPGKTSRALQDGGRLFLRITADGAKQWRLKYQIAPGPAGERMKVLGMYPAVSIAQAREAAAQVRAAAKPPKPLPSILAAPALPPLAPMPEPIAAAQVPTFGQVAAHWVEFDKEITAAALYRKRLHVQKFASLHHVPVNRVTEQQCIALHDAIRAESGLSTAKRAGMYLDSIFEHAARWGVHYNPAKNRKGWVGRSDSKALAKRRHAHITDPDVFGLLMERVDLWQSPQGPTSASFIRFIARVPVRASELAGARWSEFRDLDKPDKALWCIPGERMKEREPHEVPLSRQAVAILLEQREHVAKHYPAGSEFVFPSRDTGRKHIDGDNQRRTLTFLGYGPYLLDASGKPVREPGADGKLRKVRNSEAQSVHGFRHAFETFSAKLRGPHAALLAHLCTAHKITGVMARYVTTDMPEQRRELFQWWADEIDRMQRDYKVQPSRGEAA